MATLLGFFGGAVEQVHYNIVGDFFEPKYRVRAYIVFTMVTLLHYPILYLIPNLIHIVKWRPAWQIIGGTTMGLGVLTLLTVREPSKQTIIKTDTDKEEIN